MRDPLAKCPKCGRVTPYRLKDLELFFKTTIQCRKCGTSIPIGERLDDQLNVDLWEATVLERARRTYDQCKRLLTNMSSNKPKFLAHKEYIRVRAEVVKVSEDGMEIFLRVDIYEELLNLWRMYTAVT